MMIEILTPEQIGAIEFDLQQGIYTYDQAWTAMKRSHEALRRALRIVEAQRDTITDKYDEMEARYAAYP